jgi:hypothetical protein
MTAEAVLLGSATLVAVIVTLLDVAIVAGAVYTPEEDIEPTEGDMDQVTVVFVEPVTVAVNG